jgi:hydroxymethylglutaryl-CoA synthase
MVGITGYGAYVPRYRIRVEEIAAVWGKDAESFKKSLNIGEKSVPGMDEDTITISVQAAKNALAHAGIAPERIGAVYVGSESHPYAVKPSATVVAEAIGATPNMTAADYQFACKAGTAAIQTCMGLVASGMVEYGLAIGADTSQGRPADALEYTAGAGGGAFIIGNKGVVATIEATVSFTTDTPDFWRREGEEYPRHGARFTGVPAYFKHTSEATKLLLEKTGYNVSDFNQVIFHQPNGKFPLQAAKMLGIPAEKLERGLLTPRIGNLYAGAVPVALANVLDHAHAGELILVTSFGSGAGSDSFAIRATDAIEERRANATPVEAYLHGGINLSYGEYAKHRHKIRM